MAQGGQGEGTRVLYSFSFLPTKRHFRAAACPGGRLPTRQVVIADEPHPQVELVTCPQAMASSADEATVTLNA
jgi:hypothetical protein